LRGHKDPVQTVDVNRQGTLIASGDRLGVIKVWDARTGAEAFTLSHGAPGPIQAVKFSPDGRRLATGGTEGTVRLWDVQRHQELGRLTHGGAQVISLAFFPDGKTVLIGTATRGAM